MEVSNHKAIAIYTMVGIVSSKMFTDPVRCEEIFISPTALLKMLKEFEIDVDMTELVDLLHRSMFHYLIFRNGELLGIKVECGMVNMIHNSFQDMLVEFKE